MATQEQEAQRLRSFLESATNSPGDIISACHAVESLSRHSPRLFFRFCFPALLRRVFGFDDLQSNSVASSGGWLSLVSANETAAGVLIALLSPESPLFRSLLASDSENVVRYIFPFERLPDWVRRLLAVDRGAALLENISILFRSKLKPDLAGSLQLELDIFQYYIFWFAYYSVCQGDPRSMSKPKPGISRSPQLLKAQFENWAASIPGKLHSLQQGTLVTPLHPYLQLLQLYLSHFVGPAMISWRDGLALYTDPVPHSDILVETLIDFWLIDDDPCPFPLATCQALQLHTLAPAPVYVAPGRELSNAVRLMINYFGALLQTQLDHHEHLFSPPETPVWFRRKAQLLSDIRVASPASVLSPGGAPYLQALQRPMYRFFLRAFCFWPLGTPVGRVAPLVDLWLQYLEPWAALLLQPKESGVVQPGSRVVVHELHRFYSAYWQGYVVSNFPFYSSLVSHFLEFALKFLMVDMEMIFQLTCKVLGVLAKSDELLNLLRNLEASYADHFLGRQHYVSSPLNDRVSAVQEHLQDWEEGITIPEQEQGEMLRSSVQLRVPKLHFFTPTENGGHHVLQTMILQAEAEVRACCTEKLPVSAKTLEKVKALVKKVFNQDICAPPTRTQSGNPLPPPPEESNPESSPTTTAGLQRHSWAEVKYKGDWMRRPIESQEVAWLVRLLVHWSDLLNRRLGFSSTPITPDQQQQRVEPRGESPVEALCPDALKPLLRGFIAATMWFLRELGKRGFRINLRPLAQKPVLAALFLVLLFKWLVF